MKDKKEKKKKKKKKENKAALIENKQKTNGEDNAIAENDGAAPADEAATKSRSDDWLIWEYFLKGVGELWNSGEPGKAGLEITLTHAMRLPW